MYTLQRDGSLELSSMYGLTRIQTITISMEILEVMVTRNGLKAFALEIYSFYKKQIW